MIVYDIAKKAWFEQLPKKPAQLRNLFVMGHVSDVQALQAVFGFDESTVLECTDLDESVRFASFDGYDFISLVNMELVHHKIELSEVNIYVSADYVVVVIPDSPGEALVRLEDNLMKGILEIKPNKGWTNMAVYAVFNTLLAELSDMLENLEAEVVALQEHIISQTNTVPFESLSGFRHMAYTVKKQLRASSYLGAQIMVDPNDLIHPPYERYFLNIDTRLKKLYDFAESINELCSQLVVSYESKLTMRTNDIVNKLTILTVFFGPLTVITGIYGMNFKFMPELNQPWGYPAALLLMATVSGVIYWILKRNKWL